MNKSYRQGQILKLIRERPVSTQEELARLLRASTGAPATQVTLSRDIRELGLVKTKEGYRQLSASTGPALSAVAREYLRDIRPAGNMVVLKTSPGNANSLAVALDREDLAEVVGSVAGDDTVLVVAPDEAAARKLAATLLGFLEERA